jgi:hypothetical protein
LPAPATDFLGCKNIFERTDAIICGNLADMRMIDDDEIVARRKVGDRMAFETFQRLARPSNQAGNPSCRGFQRLLAAGMIPGQPFKATTLHHRPPFGAGTEVSVSTFIRCQWPAT